jgi:hypothetical protein
MKQGTAHLICASLNQRESLLRLGHVELVPVAITSLALLSLFGVTLRIAYFI